jgi:hypothetical protein
VLGHRRRTHLTPTCVSALIVASSLLTPVEAATDPVIPPSLQACASLRKNSERLACYDQAMASLASSNGDEPNASASTPEALFGASASTTRPAAIEEAAQPESLESLTARVKSLREDATRLLVIELDNGQTWRQLNASTSLLLQVGDEVTITRAALNSFRISTPTGRGARVKRQS